jgi:microsomal dipeptidase-like Zn-dependent dipeptidase
MHAGSLYRAYQGGLRVLIADTVDTQLLSQLWTYQGASALPPSPGFDLNSAITQIQYIKGLAANNDWMRIVYSAAEARAAVQSNKLAVILGVEMDSLSLSDIDTLYTMYGVRHIIPIHLADNDFGGTAEYDNTFNSNSRYLNGTWETPLWDDCLNFQFDAAGLETISFSPCPSSLSSGNCPNLQTMDPMTFQNIYGPPCSDPTSGVAGFHGCGVRNPKGIDSSAMAALMSKPILLDVAHMSQQAADETLTLAEQFGFPVMDSHTGIRDDDPNSCPVRQGVADFLVTERSLPLSQAKRIAALHGVIGLGTAREPLGAGDGVSEWWADYVSLQGVGFSHGKGVALGTDANGLSWQIPHGNLDVGKVDYPVTVASSFAPPPGVETPALPMYTLGSRSFDINNDGIAVYGMLPDFLSAVDSLAKDSGSVCDGGTCAANIAPMFHTAEDVIEMWELATTASDKVPCGNSMQCCSSIVDGSCLDQ